MALAQQADRAAQNCTRLLDGWRALWMAECGSFGFEVLEGRLAWVQSRLLSCSRRITAYCQGELPDIPELAQPRQLVLRKPGTNQLHGVYFWRQIVTTAKAF